MFNVVKKLDFDTKEYICKGEDYELFILRPSQLSRRFKNYDVNKNFQIWIQNKERSFRPNHLRVMIDLYLRTRSRPDLKETLLICFDNIFYHSCPDEEIKHIENELFEHSLNSLKLTANLHQLFIIEQDYCYNKESKYDPPTLFYQGWVRQFIDGPKEIDNMCMSICNRQPPAAKYTHKENKKHSKYSEIREDLWYLEE